MAKHTPPVFDKKAFHCPHCGTFAQQTWTAQIDCTYTEYYPNGGQSSDVFRPENVKMAVCKHCSGLSIWIKKKMIYPLIGGVEMANEDLSDTVKAIYNEARTIVNLSPRGAAALLRLALQTLCVDLGEKGKNINEDIASLVKKGLPLQLQQALDALRVIGNHAVHPGTIELNENPDTALALFGLINVIADYLITQPNKIAMIYGGIPEKDRGNIVKRDS